MKAAIKALEEIGQNTSLKQHDSLMEMLDKINVESKSLDTLNIVENVCVLIPEDEEGEGNNGEDE